MKTFGGKRILIETDQNDRVEYIKSQIEDKEGIGSDKQKLIYINQELENCKTISDYSIKSDETIYLLTVSDHSMLIFINYGKDKIIPLEVDPIFSIRKIKSMIEEIKGFEQEKQLLVYKTNMLKQEDKTLEDLSIEGNSTLYLIYPSRGGYVVYIKIASNKQNPNDINRSFPLEVLGTDLVKNLKEQIENREKISVNRQKLVFAGKLLEDEKALLNTDVSSFSPIMLVISE